MASHEQKTDDLIQRAANNDRSAIELLLNRHRERLRQMIAVRFDQRVNPRLDPSDVVQDVLVKAIKKLPEYAKERPIAFYPWLRQLALEQIVETYRVHVAAQRRSVDREVDQNRCAVPLPDQSAVLLADVLVAQQSAPSRRLEREQMREQVQTALGTITVSYREVLVMRYLEKLTMREIADCVGASESAIKMRHLRALKELGKALGNVRSSDG